jgi:outer membrane protein assembly factor BamA
MQFGQNEDIETTTVLRGLGIPLSYDSRSSVYYPRKGFQVNIKYITFPDFMGNSFVSNNLDVEYDHYLPFRNNKDVLGLRLNAAIGIGDLSFNQQNIVGETDIRGYTQGKYRGDQVLAIQGEYRWNPLDKFGVVGFLGFATVFNSIDNEFDGLILPGLGTGFRYTVFPDNKFNVGLDVAVGRDDWGIYFRVGEAF